MSEGSSITTAIGNCSLQRSARRTLAISVLPDGKVQLVAPLDASEEAIAGKVAKRCKWILEQQRTFQEMNAVRPSPRFCNGATHRYLGRQYRLKISRGKAPRVKLIGGYFQVTTATGAENEIQELVAIWFRERAREQLSKRLQSWSEWCRRRKLPQPKLYLRSMPRRWGSAHRDGRIYLNPDLVHAPPICIDYVVAHEVCHLRFPNHGPEFYRQLDQAFPAWRAVKNRLERAEL